MKKTKQTLAAIISLIILTFFAGSALADVCLGNYTIDDIDTAGDIALISGCTEITGSMSIGSTSLTDLTGLEGLTRLRGFLTIQYNNQLTSLSGLENLTNLGGYGLGIFFNNALTNLCALYNVNNTGDLLNIYGNTLLSMETALALETQLISNGFTGTSEIENNDGSGLVTCDVTDPDPEDNSTTILLLEDYDLAIWDFSGAYAPSLPDNATIAHTLIQDSKGKLTGAGTFRAFDNMTIPVEVKGKVKLKKDIVTVDYKVKGKNDAGDKVDNKYKLELTLPSDPPAATEAEAAPDNETMVLEGTSKGKICVKGEKCENVEDEAVSLPLPDGMTGEALVTVTADYDDKGKVTSGQSSLLLSNDDLYVLETKGKFSEKKGERKFKLKGDNETTKGIKINATIENDNGTATKIDGKALGQKLKYKQ